MEGLADDHAVDEQGSGDLDIRGQYGAGERCPGKFMKERSVDNTAYISQSTLVVRSRLLSWQFLSFLMFLICQPCLASAQDQKQRLIAASQAFRFMVAVDIERVNASFAPKPAKPFDSRLLTRQPVPKQVMWRYFIINTQAVYGALHSDRPIVGFYNPLLDFWLVTEWQLPAGIPVLVQTYLLPGAAFDRPASKSGNLAISLPRWLAAVGKAPPAEALSFQGRTAVSNFRRFLPADRDGRDPLIPLRSMPTEPNLRALSARLDLFLGGLAAFRIDNLLFQHQQKQQQLIDNGSISDLLTFFGQKSSGAADAAQALRDVLPQRPTGLQVDAMLRLNGADIVVSSRDDDGRWYLLTRFERPDGATGTAVPRSMWFVDATGDGLP